MIVQTLPSCSLYMLPSYTLSSCTTAAIQIKDTDRAISLRKPLHEYVNRGISSQTVFVIYHG